MAQILENSTSSAESSLNQTGYDDYLNPCYTCTPTEDEYGKLATFELLAKYPELSGDPLGNETGSNTRISNNAATSGSSGTSSGRVMIDVMSQSVLYSDVSALNNKQQYSLVL